MSDLDPQQRQPLLRCLLLDPGPSFHPPVDGMKGQDPAAGTATEVAAAEDPNRRYVCCINLYRWINPVA
ncbi:hypothetical protein L195_g046425 [Trifolium pratense]|uniref:Uncharacterized protein n=1 Tax=Trifolium pratense TaxID=57577 RepID=A0A2K3MHN8_TRIPR|nr:hypothetical protein L195_g046425 [Trifolium pratense]